MPGSGTASPGYSSKPISPRADSTPPWVGELFQALAVPRLPGTPALRVVEQAAAERLAALGYQVESVRFAAAPRRVMASVVAGAGLGWTALALSPLLLIALPGWPVALVGVAALGMVALVSHGVAQGHLPIPAPRVEATNLVGRRGNPALWLVAHLDSKSQRVSLRGRVVGAVSAILGSAALLAVLALRVMGPVHWGVVLGVVALLLVGVLTGAEEFGMEGARLWVAQQQPAGAFVNFDGLDSRGRYRVQLHPAVGGVGTSPLSAPDVARAVTAALGDEGHDVVVRPLPLGTFVDGAVLARAGMPGVTLSRGDWQTLGVVHTARDVAQRVEPGAAVRAGYASARAADQLLG
jgi:hypothetical protein